MGKKDTKVLAEIASRDVRFEGDHFKLPAPLGPDGIREGARILLDKADAEEQIVQVHEVIEGSPFDALVAFHATLAVLFGWATTKATTKHTMFGSFKVPPQYMDVRVGPEPGDVIQVPTGLISAPTLGFDFEVHPHEDGLHLTAEAKQWQAAKVRDIAAEVRRYLAENSIYRGKALRMPAADAPWQVQPEFIRFVMADRDNLIFSRDVANDVEVNLFTHIIGREHLASIGSTFKRTVVLSGPYGTGKSLTMRVAGNLATRRGITFIMVDSVAQLKAALAYANRYAPAVVAVEDIDRETGSRTDEANALFNALSGVLSATSEVLVVASTNHADRIDQTMIRPGRIDALVNIPAPDAEAVEKLIYLYGSGFIQVNGRMGEVSEKLAGHIPATIAEVVQRAKLGMLMRALQDGKDGLDGSETVNEADLLSAASGMGLQLGLLNEKREEKEPTIDRAIKNALEEVVREQIKSVDTLFGRARAKDLKTAQKEVHID